MKLLSAGPFFQVVKARMQDEEGTNLNRIAVRMNEVLSDQKARDRFFDATTGKILSPIHEFELGNEDKVKLEYAGWKIKEVWLSPVDPDDLRPMTV